MLKIILSVLLIISINLLSNSRYYYLSMIAVLFPTFTLITLVNNINKNPSEIQKIMLNGLYLSPSLIIFMLSVYLLANKINIIHNIFISLSLSTFLTLIILKFIIK